MQFYLILGIAVLFLSSNLSAIPLPDATAKTLVFSDQLDDAVGSANLTFNATHFVGIQKITKPVIAAYKAINPNFIVLQYHKSFGVDLQLNITAATPPAWNKDCDTLNAWISRNPSFGSKESYYLHYTNTIDSAHRIQHYWDNVNEYYLADLRHAGFRQYVAETNVWRCQNIGFDGTFFDATYFPSHGYSPSTWFDSVPYSAGGITRFGDTWNQTFAVPYWTAIRTYFHASGRDYLCIVNCDQMVTGWYNDLYLDAVDGAMAEGFFTYGGKLVGADWALSAGRILRYLTGAGKNKVLIAQCSPGSTNISLRRWCIANYLLLKNKYSYYNITQSSYANWWPEYDITLDSFVSQPTTLSDLLVPGTTSLYKRDYKAGYVLVNPGSTSQSYTLTQQYFPVTFTGGGDVVGGTKPSMSIIYGTAISGTVSVAAGEVLILQKIGTAIRTPRPSKNSSRVPQRSELFTLSGKQVAKNGTTAHGVNILRTTDGQGGYDTKRIVR